MRNRFTWFAAWLTLVPAIPAQVTETVVHSFAKPYGSDPNGVIVAPGSAIYGTTQLGGPADAGVVYRWDANGYTVLHTFTNGADGGFPLAGVIRDSAGNLYGTTQDGGAWGGGVVFKVNPTGCETVLYSFTGGADGGYPHSGVIRDAAGNIYGTTYNGGTAGEGVVFKLDAAGQESVLYTFSGGVDGSNPWGLIHDAAGNLYGTTYRGGATGCGVIFKIDAASHYMVLYDFNYSNGCTPMAGVVGDPAGNLYGTAYSVSQGGGIVYKLDRLGNYSVLHRFVGSGDGDGPFSGLTRDQAGNLYGKTDIESVVYKIDPAGNFSVVYPFGEGGPGGSNPHTGVTIGPGGRIWGTANGGKYNAGVVFVLEGATH